MTAGLAEAKPGRANHLDLLRLIFAGMVMLSHAFEYVDGNRGREPLTLVFHTVSLAEVAVDGFFILSGFLITRSWQQAPLPNVFLRKRVMRLYPAFVVAFLVAVLVVGRIAAADPVHYYASLDLHALGADLLELKPPRTPPVFAGLPFPWVDGAMWTIQFEFLCYLAVAVLGITGVLQHRGRVALLWGAAIILYLSCSAYAGNLAGPHVGDGIGSLVRLGTMFLSGMMFATFDLVRRDQAWLKWSAIACLPLGLSVPLLAEPTLATAGAYLMFSVGLAPRPAGSPRLPDISYGAYLYGAPAEMLLIYLLHLPPLAVFVLGSGIALLLGWASWTWIEAPALRRYPAARERSSLAFC